MSELDWMHDDITWCARECSDTTCIRNRKNRRENVGYFSVGDMYMEGECPADADASAFQQSMRKYLEQLKKEKGEQDGTQAR